MKAPLLFNDENTGFKITFLMIDKQMTFEWLDFLITIALDSNGSKTDPLTQTQYENILEKAAEKKQQYFSFINRQSLSLNSRRKIQQLIKQHYGRLLILLDQSALARGKVNPSSVMTENALQYTAACIYELLIYIESNFGDYLDSDERTPVAYLAEFTREHQGRLDKVRQQLVSQNADPKLVSILSGALSPVTRETEIQPVSFRSVFYQRELLHGIEQLLAKGQHNQSIDDALVELLIYLNFNSRPFINYYTQHLSGRINAVSPAKDKISQLLLHHKQFNQMHRRPGVKLSTNDSDVKKVISNWFTQEIEYLKEQSQTDTGGNQNLPGAQPVSAPAKPQKVMVLLSVDQIGLFLRALDSLRVLKATSLNAVFQSITPFLSTPRRAEISYDSMRSKSYSFEDKDKQTVIKVLESVITWIKEY